MLEELHRIFLGDQDLGFAWEVFFRTVIIYFYTLALMRWLGGRTVAQLSIVEFLLVIAIGSAVGDSLFYPDVPLLPAMFAIFLVAGFNKLVDEAILSSDLLTRLFEGRPRIVVTEGRVHGDRLRRQGIGMNELYLKLRERGVTDLSEVKFAILEANGSLSVLRRGQEGAAGLYHPPAVPQRELARMGKP
ncbi:MULTISPECIES: DUF421 domain-containing protein [Paracoccus]|jgi:uncharacterized membrane protein YcaP (DUF421 family)|uniref:YetF C-terminal domain-containing protein n=1 Tax=Paracoccus denitrificans (strain Pd 1222) TaxID=318586 RepID=A1B402_PARDP|nr:MULTISPECIES: YetF domain-containing protein [Paracoccus]ABL70246.1 protein of unknown function DUF421 [Paracoccus denitrificans PD1222]MBB4627154.1 uncharacterized membrane protein YcaP (DUF421 family) [Paracoccus denitrificans]MCU7428073.1 DUF421 domain-containing protein [Paracoccus denitrificans]MDK8873966.1 DUF421 domain-containing protein [Paracoccus sp. SSJ]QAR25597.1 DUF421 domain-containing protein [Paracoccus denitrificans]